MINWKEEYRIGIKLIDEQHKKLFEIGSRAYEVALGVGEYDYYDDLIEILDELKEYAHYHFNCEEDLMNLHGYYGLEDHKTEHMFFIKKIRRIEKKDLESSQGETIMQLIQFIADWITSHIHIRDREYASYFKKKNL